jgi:DNA polymerase-3 subunit epsilon
MLSRLPVLLVDCQTTGTRPDAAHVVEIAWAVTSAEALRLEPEGLVVESSLVRLPEGASFPRAAREVSGLDPDALAAAPPADEVWERFVAAAGDATDAVAHYARFEEGFLRRWAERSGVPFPFEATLLCTHRFAKRLLPGLPSASLRAVAGFLGRDLPDLRRSAENVAATAWIWERLVRRFEDDEASARSVPYADFAELRAWMDAKPKRREPAPRAFATPRERRLALPDRPGVYRFLASSGRILYVGKATSLKDRVNSYFRARKSPRKRLAELMAQVHDVRVTEVATDVEAALLENDEIKRWNPPYNVALRERSRTPVFASRDFLERSDRPGTDRPLGPFPSAEALDDLQRLVDALRTGDGLSTLFWGMLEEDVVAEGLEVFRRRHALGDTPSAAELLVVGARVRARAAREEKAKRDDASASDDEDVAEAEEAEAAEERVWDADEVASSLERRLAALLRAARRARWQCRLVDAVVAWDVAGEGTRCLVVEGGAVVEARWLEPDASAPCPPGARRPLVERQALARGLVFDRMRILVTEIARLAGIGNVRVRLGPGRRQELSGEGLRRALRFGR